jgi:hypothetical protein
LQQQALQQQALQQQALQQQVCSFAHLGDLTLSNVSPPFAALRLSI